MLINLSMIIQTGYSTIPGDVNKNTPTGGFYTYLLACITLNYRKKKIIEFRMQPATKNLWLFRMGFSVGWKWVFPEMVEFPPKSSILIGFSMIFTIHFGGTVPPIFLETPKFHPISPVSPNLPDLFKNRGKILQIVSFR